VRLVGERPGNGDSLLLPTGDHARNVVGAWREPDGLEETNDGFPALPCRTSAPS